MKKLFTLFLSGVIAFAASAQCDPDLSMTEPGLAPDSDSLECIVQGVEYSETIYFMNFTTVSGVTVNWLRIDSISNAPCGMKYALNDVDKTYNSGEKGCLQMWGTTTDAVGQYKLGIWVTVSTTATGEISGEAGALSASLGGPDFSYYVRVKASAGATCTAVDTTDSNNKTASCWKAEDHTAISEPVSGINGMNIVPNPVVGISYAKVNITEGGVYTTSISNIIGQVVSSENVSFRAGENSIKLNTDDLENGVYFFSVFDGKKVSSARFVVNK